MSKRDDILRAVAEGRLSPEEAARQLDALDRDEQPSASQRSEREPRRVRVRAATCSVRIVADPGVSHVVAQGPHNARQDGDTFVISSDTADPGVWTGGFAFGHHHWSDWRDWGPWSRGWRGPRPEIPQLSVRINPDLPLAVELLAGSLIVKQVTHLTRAEVTAGSARIEGARGPLELWSRAASVTMRCLLDQGASSVRCEAGAVTIELESGSDVRIRTRQSLSRIVLPSDEVAGIGDWAAGGTHESVVGDGTATLDIDASLANLTVATESATRAGATS